MFATSKFFWYCMFDHSFFFLRFLFTFTSQLLLVCLGELDLPIGKSNVRRPFGFVFFLRTQTVRSDPSFVLLKESTAFHGLWGIRSKIAVPGGGGGGTKPQISKREKRLCNRIKDLAAIRALVDIVTRLKIQDVLADLSKIGSKIRSLWMRLVSLDSTIRSLWMILVY